MSEDVYTLLTVWNLFQMIPAIYVRGMMEGNNSKCKGHLKCSELVINDDSFIQAIPELIARKKGGEITHEAAVGW